MIQNYIRDGVLPPPVNKRFYTHKHLATLVLIDRLKTVFDIPTVKAALQPYMDDEGVAISDYTAILGKLTNVTAAWQQSVAPQVATESDGGILLSMMFAAELKGAIV